MTAFPDLRAYLDRVAGLGELRTVPGADTRSDIGPITETTAWSPEHPMLLFEDIPGGPRGWRVAVHAFDS
ncbi:MAG: UbiD family decarboxylase, partial [bacterium]|nr:UbiD family decarboxylase [bacterium]